MREIRHIHPLRGLFSMFVVTRFALFAIATFAVMRLPINVVEAQGFHLAPQPHTFLEAWARYDACWYVAIAQNGYGGPIGPWGDMRPGLFPLFPALVTVMMPLVHTPLLAGLIVANGFYLTFLILLWQLVRLDWTTEIARRTAWVYLFFPSAIFLSGAYSESVLLALTTGALLAARYRRWFYAGVLAGLATLARPVGILIVAPLLVEFLSTRKADVTAPREWRGAFLSMLTPVVVAAAAYLLFAASTFGDPLAAISSQAVIRGPMAWPWQPFIELWRAGPRLHTFDRSMVDAALALTAAVALPAIFKHVRPSYALYACLIVFVPLSGSLMSFNRLLLPSFPHAILLARSVRSRWVLTAILVCFGLLEVVTMTAFATWNWVA